MGFTFKYLFYCMDGVNNDNDFGYILYAICLINTTSNSKEFCFDTSNEYCVMNHLNQKMITCVYI